MIKPSVFCGLWMNYFQKDNHPHSLSFCGWCFTYCSMKDWLLIQNYIPSLNTNIIWKWMGFTSIKERITFCVVLNKKIPAETIPILICDSVSLCINYVIFLISRSLENFFYLLYLFQLINFIPLRFSLVYHNVICNSMSRTRWL